MLIRQVVGLNLDFLKMLIDSDYLSLLEKESYQINNLIFLIATDEEAGEHSGYALFKPKSDNKSYELIHMRINLEYLNLGIGRSLLKRGIEIIREAGGKTVYVPVLPEDYTLCRGFFEKMGFAEGADVESLIYSIKEIKASTLLKNADKFADLKKHIVSPKMLESEYQRRVEATFNCNLDTMDLDYTKIFYQDDQPMGLISFSRSDKKLIFSNFLFNNKLKEGLGKIFTILLEAVLINSIGDEIEKVIFNNTEADRQLLLKNWLGEPEEETVKKQFQLKI